MATKILFGALRLTCIRHCTALDARELWMARRLTLKRLGGVHHLARLLAMANPMPRVPPVDEHLFTSQMRSPVMCE